MPSRICSSMSFALIIALAYSLHGTYNPILAVLASVFATVMLDLLLNSLVNLIFQKPSTANPLGTRARRRRSQCKSSEAGKFALTVPASLSRHVVKEVIVIPSAESLFAEEQDVTPALGTRDGEDTDGSRSLPSNGTYGTHLPRKSLSERADSKHCTSEDSIPYVVSIPQGPLSESRVINGRSHATKQLSLKAPPSHDVALERQQVEKVIAETDIRTPEFLIKFTLCAVSAPFATASLLATLVGRVKIVARSSTADESTHVDDVDKDFFSLSFQEVAPDSDRPAPRPLELSVQLLIRAVWTDREGRVARSPPVLLDADANTVLYRALFSGDRPRPDKPNPRTEQAGASLNRRSQREDALVKLVNGSDSEGDACSDSETLADFRKRCRSMCACATTDFFSDLPSDCTSTPVNNQRRN